MSVNFELYKVFYHVAKSLSFSQAANELFISQSAVSQSIKTLEGKLDTKLFFRHTKLVKLTYEGSLLFQHVEQAFNFIKSGERSIHSIHSLKQGEVKIGASDTICKYYLLPFLKKFHQLYPQIKIHITNSPSPHCVQLLKKGSVDISIVNLSDKISYKNLNVHEIKEIKDVFIGGRPFKHLKNKEVSIKELENYPFLMLKKNSTTRVFFDDFIKKHDANVAPEIELGSIDLLMEMTKIGLGLSFVMEDAIKDELTDNDLFIINLKEKLPKRSLGVIFNENIPLSMAAKKFMDLLLV